MERRSVRSGIKAPPALSVEECKELVRQYSTGIDVKNKLIHGFMRLAFALVGVYARNYPHRGDELLSTALFELVKAINDWPIKKRDDNISAFVSSRVSWACRKALEDRPIVHVPRDTYYTRKRRGQETDTLPKTITGVQVNVKQRKNDVKIIEDILETITKTPFEKEIIRLRVAGYNDTEIASMAGCSQAYVNRIRNRLYERFLEHWEK